MQRMRGEKDRRKRKKRYTVVDNGREKEGRKGERATLRTGGDSKPVP